MHYGNVSWIAPTKYNLTYVDSLKRIFFQYNDGQKIRHFRAPHSPWLIIFWLAGYQYAMQFKGHYGNFTSFVLDCLNFPEKTNLNKLCLYKISIFCLFGYFKCYCYYKNDNFEGRIPIPKKTSRLVMILL